MIGLLFGTGLTFTNARWQEQLLQSTAHLLFIYFKLKVCCCEPKISDCCLHKHLPLCLWLLMQVAASHKGSSIACSAGRTQNQGHGVRCHSNQAQHVRMQQKGPCIDRLDPALQQQWDHADNAHLGPINITPKNGRKVWWICDQCPDGHPHRWEAHVNSRTRGNGCPQCRGRKVCKHNCLATKSPLVAAQWDYEANDGTPDSVVAHSSQKVGWLCDACGHKWSATPNTRVSRTVGCPQCAKADAKGRKQVSHPTFAECKDPEVRALLAQWDHPRNAQRGHFPDKVSLQSQKQIFWLCNNCPAGQKHSWSAPPHKRTARSKTGCPLCAGHAACKCNSLQALRPGIAAEWDHTKNEGQLSDHTASSNRMAWWFSRERGSWQQPINERTDQRLKRNQ